MKIKKELAVKIVTDSDFDRFAKEHYGHNPEIAVAEEWHNDSRHLYENITKENKGKWSEWNRRSFEEYKQDGMVGFGIVRDILEDLVADGILPEGSYLVTLSW